MKALCCALKEKTITSCVMNKILCKASLVWPSYGLPKGWLHAKGARFASQAARCAFGQKTCSSLLQSGATGVQVAHSPLA